VGAVSGSVVFLVDFFVFGLGDSSVADSLLGDFSVLASDFSDFLVLLFSAALLFFSFEVLLLVLFGLVAVSAAGLLVVAGDFLVGAADAEGDVFAVALAAGVVAGTDAVVAGVVVAPTLAVVAGEALAFVEAALVVVVPVVPVVPVEVAPTLKLGVTP